jgi:hypothetical protein
MHIGDTRMRGPDGHCLPGSRAQVSEQDGIGP